MIWLKANQCPGAKTPSVSKYLALAFNYAHEVVLLTSSVPYPNIGWTVSFDSTTVQQKYIHLMLSDV